MKTSLALGLMSGSSLDGLDMALVRFQEENGRYDFRIVEAETMPYSEEWKSLLSEAFHKKPEDLVQLDKDYGRYLGRKVLEFCRKHDVKPDFVASHGHTVFHRPEERYTLQIGDGASLAEECGILTVNDFRTEDVLKGGQGAPLVPIGDKILFSDYPMCLNIGGIANVSYDENGKRIAYDICIANQALNHLAGKAGLEYDRDGLLARSGKVDKALLECLNDNPFYTQAPPKSLGREFFETFQKDMLNEYAVEDALATFTEHIAQQVSEAVGHLPAGKMLATGGGARNGFLIERMQSLGKHEIVVPDAAIIDYKEALLFAFLGLLRLEGKTNVLSSVTGAPTDSCSGVIWKPKA